MFFETKFSMLYLKIRITSKQRIFLTFVALFDSIWIKTKRQHSLIAKKNKQKINAQDIKHKNWISIDNGFQGVLKRRKKTNLSPQKKFCFVWKKSLAIAFIEFVPNWPLEQNIYSKNSCNFLRKISSHSFKIMLLWMLLILSASKKTFSLIVCSVACGSNLWKSSSAGSVIQL